MTDKSLITEQKLLEYLTGKINAELDNSDIVIDEDTVWYLGNLLTHFAQSDNFLIQESQQRSIPTLAFIYQDARETHSTTNRHMLLRKLGDSALFMGAWFSEIYRRKGIGRDYFVGMGHAAYDYLSDNALQYRHTFNELAQNLPELIALAAKVLARDSGLSAEEIFDIYRRWQINKDEMLRKQLEAVGIVPLDTGFQ